MPKLASLLPFLAAAACAPVPAPTETDAGGFPVAEAVEAAGAGFAPAGAAIGDGGFWTIGEVPASPYPQVVPADTTGESLVEQYARENGISLSEAQDSINGPPRLHRIWPALNAKLRANEANNYVDARMVRDPAVVMEIWFKRDAAQTLAKYTKDPIFRPMEGGLNEAEQEARRALWAGRMEAGSIMGMSIDPFTGEADIAVGIPETRFLAIAESRGWDLSNVKASYAQEQSAAFADPALASGVRVFAREQADPVARNQALGIGRISLDDGCFTLGSRGDEAQSSLVMFGYGSTLDRDDEGYLVVRSGDSVYRVGEIAGWSGPNGVDEDNPDVIALREACGTGKIVNVAEPVSYRLFSLPYPSWVSNYAEANGLSRQAAWDRVVACMKQEEAADIRGLDARDRCIRQFN